jgi:hypothetical protein
MQKQSGREASSSSVWPRQAGHVLLTKLPDNRNAVQFWQHHVEHQHIKLADLSGFQAFPAIEREGTRVSELVNTLLELSSQLRSSSTIRIRICPDQYRLT